MTILVAPIMTCSACIPVYTLIISAFTPARQVWGLVNVNLQGLVIFGLHAAGIAAALDGSFLAKFFFWRDDATGHGRRRTAIGCVTRQKDALCNFEQMPIVHIFQIFQ